MKKQNKNTRSFFGKKKKRPNYLFKAKELELGPKEVEPVPDEKHDETLAPDKEMEGERIATDEYSSKAGRLKTAIQQ